MNASQRKILVIACFVFCPIVFLIGAVQESAFLAFILPLGLIFAGLYFKRSNVKYEANRDVTYDEYANVILPLTIKAIAFGFVNAISAELKKHDNTKNISDEELKRFITSNFDIQAVRYEFIEIMRKSYTHEEFQYLANNALTPIGLRIFDKSQALHKEFENILTPELTRVSDLMEVKFNLFE